MAGDDAMSPQTPTPAGHGAVANGAPSSYAARHNLPSHFIGGNSLDVAPPGPVRDFVASNDGHTPITSVRVHGVLASWDGSRWEQRLNETHSLD